MRGRKCKRTYAVLLAAVAAGCFAGDATASSSDNSLLKTLESRGYANIAVVAAPPWSVLKPDGSVSGFVPDLTAAALKLAGVPKIHGVLSTYSNGIPGLNAGRWDIVSSGLYVNPERCTQVLFSSPITGDTDSFLVKKGNPLKIHTYHYIAKQGLKLGATTGDYQIKLAESEGVKASQISEYPTPVTLVAALKAGRIDVIEQGTLVAKVLIAKNPDLTRVGPVADGLASVSALAFPNGQTALRDSFNRALAKMKQTGQFQSISRKYGFDPTVVSHLSTASACRTAFPHPKL
jgi:polar amino acid transport system substrate-binding protein